MNPEDAFLFICDGNHLFCPELCSYFGTFTKCLLAHLNLHIHSATVIRWHAVTGTVSSIMFSPQWSY